jgi:hypothetical protein
MIDLSIYRKEAIKNNLLLEEKARKEAAISKQKEIDEKLLEQQKIENDALEIFNNIPKYCKNAAKSGRLKACIFSIDSDEDNANKSYNCKVKKQLIKLLDENNVKHEYEYKFIEDDGYGEDYIKQDRSYHDYYVVF